MKYMGLDSLIDSKTGILKNYLGIREQAELDKAERDITTVKMTALNNGKKIPGNFDLQHLQKIHQYLFGEIYPFAGKIREHGLQKGNQAFAMGYRIVPEADKLFTQLKKENYLKETKREDIAERLAFYLGEINVLHPFREGNGRAQRVFIMQLAEEAGFELNFNNVTQKEMIEASIQAHSFCNYSLLKDIIERGLSLKPDLLQKEKK